MPFAISSLGLVPVRREPSDRSEQVSQLLYGEAMELLDIQKKWSLVRLLYDGYEGWVANNQFFEVDKELWENYKIISSKLCYDPVALISHSDGSHSTICLGANLAACEILGDHYLEESSVAKIHSGGIRQLALNYLGAPYLWGGRSLFGIDCSGLSQMVYKLAGIPLPRDAKDQALQGETLSFVEEAKEGDLAFFDNSEGHIIHVGIILDNSHIIHAHGKVRIDKLDHTGIFNEEKREYTHSLRIIKRIKAVSDLV